MSEFRNALQACGLSQNAAAEFLGVSLNTVKSWSAGRNPVPDGVWSDLAELFGQIRAAAKGDAVEVAGLPEGSAGIATAMARLIAISEKAST